VYTLLSASTIETGNSGNSALAVSKNRLLLASGVPVTICLAPIFVACTAAVSEGSLLKRKVTCAPDIAAASYSDCMNSDLLGSTGPFGRMLNTCNCKPDSSAIIAPVCSSLW